MYNHSNRYKNLKKILFRANCKVKNIINFRQGVEKKKKQAERPNKKEIVAMRSEAYSIAEKDKEPLSGMLEAK